MSVLLNLTSSSIVRMNMNSKKSSTKKVPNVVTIEEIEPKAFLELKGNFGTWNLNRTLEILDDKVLLKCITKFLSDVKMVSAPSVKKKKKHVLINSVGDLYQEITVPDIDMEATSS